LQNYCRNHAISTQWQRRILHSVAWNLSVMLLLLTKTIRDGSVTQNWAQSRSQFFANNTKILKAVEEI